MAGGSSVSVGAEMFGDPELGLWCPDCRLWSGARVTLMLMFGASPEHLFTVTACADCGRDLSGEEP